MVQPNLHGFAKAWMTISWDVRVPATHLLVLVYIGLPYLQIQKRGHFGGGGGGGGKRGIIFY